MTDETYETIMVRARGLGIQSPGEVANYAVRILAQLADEIADGGQLLVQHGGKVEELVFPAAPARSFGPPLLKVERPRREQPGRERPTLRMVRS
jgi:hypothetical protein